MKKYILATVAAVCALCVILVGCSKGNEFELNGEGKYVDKSNGVSYIDAPACYEPIAMGEEIYGHVGEAKLYQIQGADPHKWLCESYGTVFYADDVKLPTLGEMNISYCNVVLEDTVLVKISEATAIAAIVEAYENGESVTRPAVSSDSYDINWRLKMADESVGLYYILSYIEIDEDYVVENENGEQINYGRKFIFNRFENRCVAAGDVMDAYAAEYRELNEQTGS